MKNTIQYLLVGFPFSGKTTLAKELEKRLGYKRVNIDDIKAEYGYSAVDDDHVPEEVWSKIFQKIDRLSKKGRNSNYRNSMDN